MSDSLDLGAVVAACEIESIARDERPELAQHLLLIHSSVRKIAEARARKVKHG